MYLFSKGLLPSVSQFRVAAFISATMLLSACGSLSMKDQPTLESELPTEQQAANKTATESGAEQTSVNSLLAFQGEDPMANIQLNAEIKQTYAQVAQLNKAKKHQQALNLLETIKTKYPQLSGPDYQRARIFLIQNNLDKALEAVELSLANNQRNYYSLNLKGIILRERGQFEEAKSSYQQAIEIYPPYANSHLNLGVLADIYLRDFGLALIQYQQYQSLTNGQDKKVANWILELERRIKAGG